MTDAFADDLPTGLTRLLRNVEGIHTVYATKPFVPTVVATVVEAVKNEPVGMHLVSVSEGADGLEVTAFIGVLADEAAPVVCRRAHDAIAAYLADNGRPAPMRISVRVGRVG